MIKIGKIYTLRNGVVAQRGAHDSDYSWMSGNIFHLKSDVHTVVSIMFNYKLNWFYGLQCMVKKCSTVIDVFLLVAVKWLGKWRENTENEI